MINNADLLEITLSAVLLFTVYVLLYRRYLFSVYDPLLLFLITNTFTSVLFFYAVKEWEHILYFIGCQFFLWGGFTLFKYKWDNVQQIQFNSFNLQLLRTILYVSFTLYLVANLYAASKVGFPLLTNDPTGSKSEIYASGLGIVRRINWGLSVFISCGSFFMLFVARNKLPFVLILLCQIAFSILSGSKGALLNFLFILAYILSKPEFRARINLSKYRKFNRYLKLIGVGGVAVALTVLYIERGTVSDAFFGLYNRLLLSGDIILYYYQPHIHEHFESYNALDFVSHELNSVLGLFRITDYQYPFGYQMVNLHLAKTGEKALTTVLGPNTQFFVKGHIFFGFIGGMVYSFVVGMVIGYLRRSFFVSRRFNAIYFIYTYTFVVFAFTYAIESNLFISQVFDTIIFAFPITLLSYTYLRLVHTYNILNEKENSSFSH